MPPPVFSDAALHRPAVPSPLSSSPNRTFSPPLAPREQNTLPRRETQSSPIPAPKFKFASRPARSNPILRKRDIAQEDRRNLFLRDVRKRADDRNWMRRGGDQELLKLEWWSLNRDFRQARDADVQGIVSETEIEDASRIEEDAPSMSQHDSDEMMVDAIAQEEQAELDAIISSMSQEPSSSEPTRPASPSLSDNQDYDALFMDFLSQESQNGLHNGDMEMS